MLCSLFCNKKNDDRDSVNETLNTDLLKISNQVENISKPSQHHHRHLNWFSQDALIMPKDFNYILNVLDKCIKHCTKPEIDLKNSPPYLPGTLRSFQTEIVGIIKRYESNLQELSQIYFFRISIWTLIKQCKDILRLFRHNRANIVNDVCSIPRQKLTQISLLLSHLLHALLALFPDRFYSPELFRITKSDAAQWWHSHFGQTTTVVEWKDFFHVFSKFNYISEVSQIHALRKTISITGNGHVSIYDFDVFVRLFQPWTHIVECWRQTALLHPGCISYATYEQVARLLSHWQWQPGPGSYVFRFSCTRPGQWAIGYVDANGSIFQTIVQHNKPLVLALIEGQQAGLYKYPSGRLNFDSGPLYRLLQQTNPLFHHQIVVSREQYEAYQRIDSTFELCKICDQHQKNTKLEPCGHLLCSNCWSRWQKNFPQSTTCPFCRHAVKGIEKISVVPFSHNCTHTVCRRSSTCCHSSRLAITQSSNSHDTTQGPAIPPRLTSMNTGHLPLPLPPQHPVVPLLQFHKSAQPSTTSTCSDTNSQSIEELSSNTIGTLLIGQSKVNYAQLEWSSNNRQDNSNSTCINNNLNSYLDEDVFDELDATFCPITNALTSSQAQLTHLPAHLVHSTSSPSNAISQSNTTTSSISTSCCQDYTASCSCVSHHQSVASNQILPVVAQTSHINHISDGRLLLPPYLGYSDTTSDSTVTTAMTFPLATTVTTSTSTNTSSSTLPHSPKHNLMGGTCIASSSSSDAIEKLLELTNNDLNLSHEILKYFAPRSLVSSTS